MNIRLQLVARACNWKVCLVPFVTIALLMSSFRAQAADSKDEDSLYLHFQHPPDAYSITPLIRLNDKIDRNELRWQFEEMARQGIHGVFLCPESLKNFGWKDAGMPYPYLSEEYFKAAEVFAEEAHRAGLALWIYDEVDWPSGSAGGKVVANPKFRGRVIQESTAVVYHGPKEIDIPLADPSALFAVSAQQTSKGQVVAQSIRDLTGAMTGSHLRWSVPPGDWQVSVYTLDTNPGLYSNADADLLNAEGVREFIKYTHQQYKERIEDRLKIPIAGTFTDEPHMPAFRNYVHNLQHLHYLPWTSDLLDAFQKRKGYDLRTRLPLLYHDGGPETAKVRDDFWEVVGDLFADNYFGQIHHFDRKAGWISTGHLNGEEGFWWHLIFDGGDEFANQSRLDYPGLDWIFPFDYTPNYGTGWLIPFAPKFVSSAAHVYGKKRVMEETFSGESLGASIEQMRSMVNWAYVHGVNMLVPITYKYSMRGADRPVTYPGITYQQPYWSELRPFSDYVSRLSYLLSQGHFQGRIAILLPVADVRAASQDREYVDNLTLKMHSLTNALMRAGYDFDFIDDASIQGAGIHDGTLTIGQNAYGTIILPPVRVARLDTLEKLARFHQASGNIVGLDRLPEGSAEHGCPDPEVEKVVAQIFGKSSMHPAPLAYLDETGDEIVRTLRQIEPPAAQLRGSADGVFSQHRRVENSDVFFLINSTSETREFDAELHAVGTPELWDAETGERWALQERHTNAGATTVHLILPPYASDFVVFNTRLPTVPQKRWWTEPVSSFSLNGAWDFHVEPTMTQPHIAWNFTPVPDGWQKKPENYEKINEILAGNWVERGLPYYSGKGVYEKTFDFQDLTPDRTYLLDLGRVGVVAKVWLNGNLVGERLWTPYRFDVTRYMRKGPNTLRISVANTLANYFSQFDFLKDKPLSRGGWKPWMLPSGLIGPVTIRSYRQ